MACLLQEDSEKEMHEAYVAQCLWEIDSILQGVAGAENKMPQYIDLIYPEMKKNKSDDMTADEIVEHVLEGLS